MHDVKEPVRTEGIVQVGRHHMRQLQPYKRERRHASEYTTQGKGILSLFENN